MMRQQVFLIYVTRLHLQSFQLAAGQWNVDLPSYLTLPAQPSLPVK